MTRLATTRVRAAGVLTAITMTALLAACSANDSSGDADSASSGDAGAATSREFGDAEAADGATDTSSKAGSKAGSSTGTAATPQLPRSIIATGTVSLTSKDVGETRRDVQRIVDGQGGTVTDETTETDDTVSSEDAAPAKAPRARRATKAKAKAEVAPEPEPEPKPDPQTEAIERLVAIVSSLSQDYDPVWGSLAKQTLHRVHPDFSEDRYGFAGFKELLLEAGKRGYVDLEFDQGRGNYKIRMKA